MNELLLEFIKILENPTQLRNPKRFELLEKAYLLKNKEEFKPINWETVFDSEDSELEPDEIDKDSFTIKVNFNETVQHIVLKSDGTFRII